MKVIDLINDYSNGKELPEKIKVHGTEFTYDCYLCYKSQAFDREQYLFTENYMWADWLNDEIEIIEEKEETKSIAKEIEALGYACGEMQKCFMNGWQKSLKNKTLNEEDKILEHKENYVDFANLTEDTKFDYLYEMQTEIIKVLNEMREDK